MSMAEYTLTKLGFSGGVWQGRIAARGEAPAPEIEVTHGAGEALSGVTLSPDGKSAWRLSVIVPLEHLGDGALTYLVQAKGGGLPLGGFTILAGEAPGEDLRAEVSLLRAEVELLKKALRRLAGGG
jgi:hypothetical protein